MDIAFVMDPWATLSFESDTSFALMREAAHRGHRILHVDPKDLTLEGGDLWVHATELQVARTDREPPLGAVGPHRLRANALGGMFVRTDPPFDQAYLTATWLLSFAEDAGVRIWNRPSGIRNANEKLAALRFPEWCPDTLVSARVDDIEAFAAEHAGDIMLKPLDGFGGVGVLRFRHDDSNRRQLVALLTEEGRRPIVAQARVTDPDDRRLMVLNGELVGALGRQARAGEHVSNVHSGGTVVAVQVTERDRALVAAVGPWLRAQGLLFAGIDTIGGRLLEINVTSPTLVQHLTRLGGPDVAHMILDLWEAEG